VAHPVPDEQMIRPDKKYEYTKGYKYAKEISQWLIGNPYIISPKRVYAGIHHTEIDISPYISSKLTFCFQPFHI
jgi:hypothetical protein